MATVKDENHQSFEKLPAKQKSIPLQGMDGSNQFVLCKLPSMDGVINHCVMLHFFSALAPAQPVAQHAPHNMMEVANKS